jgi:tetratricopeptide (TPR) repeat protein
MIELLLVAERLLAEGDIDRAEHLFEQVAEADPRNAIAVVGLAQVAQARGDAAGAIRQALRALEIDPEEAAAQRLVADLEEVPAAAVEPDRAVEPEPELVAAVEPEPVAAPEAATTLEPALPSARRSWLDRLLRFLRLR